MSALQLGRIWAATPVSPNIDPGAAKYKLGWVAEIPVFQMLNYINNRYDTNIVSLAERGVFEWGADITYNLAAVAWDETDGTIYISKVSSPSTLLRPSLNLSQWDKSAVQISRAQYDTAVANWANHIANTSNPHQLTTEILNTYSKAIIDQKVGVVQTALDTHRNNVTGNPHAVTAVQTGAVPVSGGSYTGLVKHLFASTGIGATGYAASLFTDATGTFLALGANSKIGLDSTNKAVFVDGSGLKSNILIESSYIAAREAVEATYVPPTPDCEVALRNNLVIAYGVGGTATLTGVAGSRGFWNKSGVAAAAALNEPRFTAMGLYIDGSTGETLTVPTAYNLWNTNNYTWHINFQMASAGKTNIGYVEGNFGPSHSGIFMDQGYLIYLSLVAGVTTSIQVAPLDIAYPHKFTVVSDATQNKTFLYFDGVLKATVNSKQDYASGAVFTLSDVGGRYLNNFRTWLSALTPQQVSNL